MPLLASVKPARTLPLTGHIQSTSSLSVPPGFSGSTTGGGGDAGAGWTIGAGGSGPTGDALLSAAPICASARSVNGTFVARGSTLDNCVLASGRASMGGPACTSGVASGVAIGGIPAGAASTSTCPISMRLGLVMLFHAASSR